MPKKKEKKVEPVKAVVDPSQIPKPSVDELIAYAKAKLGKEGVVIRKGGELETRFDLRRPSGILSLDIATGGGLPPGLVQIDGVEGTGKNLLMNYYFSKVQEIYGEDTAIFMACLEFRYDKSFGRACGLQVAYSPYEIEMEQRLRHKLGKTPLSSEDIDELMSEIGKLVVIEGGTEEILETTVTFIDSNRFQIGGIDSWDAMLPGAEEKVDLIDDPRIASASSLQTRWMHKVHAAMQPKMRCPVCYGSTLEHKATGPLSYTFTCTDGDCHWKGQNPFYEENETTIIGIRQARARMNRTSMRQSETQSGGAYSLRHGKLLDIKISRGEYVMQGTTRLGKEINWEITKGKAGTHEGKKGSFRYIYEPPHVEALEDLIDCCMQFKVINRAGAWYEFDSEEGPLKVKSRAELEDFIETRPDVIRSLRGAAMQAAGLGQIRYK